MNQPTNFQLVARMNEAFGNPSGDVQNIDWQRIRNQCKNIFDEAFELMEALGAEPDSVEFARHEIMPSIVFDNELGVDAHKVRDSLCDIHVFTYGAHHLMGINADADMQAVIDQVMTRFIKDEADKEATIALHAARGVTDVYFEGMYPTMVMKSASDQPDAPKGKFLKSASAQKEPKFYDPLGSSELDIDPITHSSYAGLYNPETGAPARPSIDEDTGRLLTASLAALRFMWDGPAGGIALSEEQIGEIASRLNIPGVISALQARVINEHSTLVPFDELVTASMEKLATKRATLHNTALGLADWAEKVIDVTEVGQNEPIDAAKLIETLGRTYFHLHAIMRTFGWSVDNLMLAERARIIKAEGHTHESAEPDKINVVVKAQS